MKDTAHEKKHYHSDRTRAQTPPRVSPRLEPVVKKRGTKAVKKKKLATKSRPKSSKR